MSAGSDFARTLDMFSAMNLGQSAELTMFTIPGAPWSKSRPRFSRGRTYQPGEDRDAEERTKKHMREVFDAPLTGNVGIGCIFFRPNRQRIDADNLIKHVCDSANGVIWNDDSQCTAVMGFIELDAENPRTVVVVGTHISTLKRGSDAFNVCVVCDAHIPLDGSRGHLPKTCSNECLRVLRGNLIEPIPCGHCGEPFRRRTTAQKFCSQGCNGDARRDRTRAAAKPRSQCIDCGQELAHTRGGRCRPCWLASWVAS